MADNESAGAGVGRDPLAARLAMDGISSDEAREYLRAQTRLADLQSEDLLREDRLRHWSLRVRHISDVMKLGFELAVAFIVIAIAIGLGLEIWAATQADGLVIDAFNVPPAMADKGLTGQVVASKLLDRLTRLQNETTSSRAASSFASDWTNDIKVEIPDTGVSLGQVVRFLHTSLGHELHLSGEMYQTPGGAALTVRMDNDAGQTFNASSGDLDGMIERAALAVYARAQPYRYSVYLFEQGKIAEAYALSKATAESGPPAERAWAYVGMANAMASMGRFEEELQSAFRAHQADPSLVLGAVMIANAEGNLGHTEAVLKVEPVIANLTQGAGAGSITPQWRAYSTHMAEMIRRELTGDYRAAAGLMLEDRWFQPVFITTQSAVDLASAHDPKAAMARLAQLSQQKISALTYDAGSDNAAETRALIEMEGADWKGAAAVLERDGALAHHTMVQSKGIYSDRASREEVVGPLLAELYARMGDWTKADAELKPLPADNDISALAHGKVETLRHNWNAAAGWFALVSARSPDIPFADSDWGAMLLAKGDLDGAIAKFETASQKGPHFADPLEMWGEALIAKNRSDLALAKFAEAAKYAPNWGRLHLKWGEALLWTGDKSGAEKQFVTVSGLDLTPSEKTELLRVLHG